MALINKTKSNSGSVGGFFIHFGLKFQFVLDTPLHFLYDNVSG